MRIRLGDLRKIIRESLGSEELALYKWEYPSRIGVLLYSPSELLSLDWNDRYELPKEIVKGYAKFNASDKPCNGAWEVSSIAGIGYGATLYGLGYALVPGGRLMPDRSFSSKRARDAWTKSLGKLKGFPLDDAKDPQTADPNDDCPVQVPVKNGGPDPVLDAAYEGPAVDPGPMLQAHEATVEKLMKILNDLGGEYTDPAEVDDVLGQMFRDISTKYFTSEFGKYYKER